MLWFFLPTLAATGLFSDHIERFVNHTIEPCDDFHDHVCAAITNKSDLFEEKSQNQLKIVLEKFSTAELRQISLEFQSNLADFPDVSMTRVELRAYKELAGTKDCWIYEIDKYLNNMVLYDGLYRWQNDPNNHYNDSKEKVTEIFNTLKKILIEEFTEAPWTTTRPELFNLLKSVEFVHFTAKNFEIGREAGEIKQRYEKCVGITPNKTKELAKKCMQYAVCPIYEKIEENRDDMEKSIWNGFAYSTNAGNFPRDNKVVLGLAYYTLPEFETPYLLGAVYFVMGHELGHAFFGKARPMNSECFRQHMYKTCNRFSLNPLAECRQYEDSGINTHFPEDASDWVGVYGGLKALRKFYPSVTNEEMNEIMKKFFYANAVYWCRLNIDHEGDEHSTEKLRVNGIVSLFPEFSEAFQCRRGSNMAKAATCLPFAGVGSPTRKRQHIRE